MLQSFIKLPLSLRLPIFIVITTLFGFITLWTTLQILYPQGAVPELKGYCCEYCGNSTDCFEAGSGLPGDKMSEICPQIQSRKLIATVANDTTTIISAADSSVVSKAPAKKLLLPIEPWDTWSNIAFIVVGLLPLAHVRGFKGFAPLFTLVCFVLGYGSGLFHGTGQFWGELGDVLGMFVVFGFLAAFSITIWLDKLNYPLVILLSVALTGLQFWLRSASGDVAALGTIALLALIPLFLASKSKLFKKQIWIGLGIFVLAVIVRYLDHWLCGIFGQHSLIQGHAAWHLIAAYGIGYIFWLQHEIAGADGETMPSV